MKRIVCFFFLAFVLGVAMARAQTQTKTAPDCSISFVLTSASPSVDLNNVPQLATGAQTGGCSEWTVTADAFNSGAGTLVFQSAATSNTAGTGPGSYSTFAGTTVSGSNPSSSFPWTYKATGYYPWVRVNASAYTGGTLRGIMQGWRKQSGGSGGGGGGNVVVTNALACLDSTNTIARASITLTTATTLQIIAASGSTSIKLCSITLATSGPSDVGLVYGTGSNCGTGTNAITGSNALPQLLGVAFDSQIPLPASQAFCISSSAAVNIGGVVTYVQN